MQDILFENGDVKIQDGDFAVGDSDVQHINDIITLNKGEHKQNLAIGFGMNKQLQSVVTAQRFKRDLKLALAQDGMDVDIDISKGIDNLKIILK
jgi:hypothetical protein